MKIKIRIKKYQLRKFPYSETLNIILDFKKRNKIREDQMEIDIYLLIVK